MSKASLEFMGKEAETDDITSALILPEEYSINADGSRGESLSKESLWKEVDSERGGWSGTMERSDGQKVPIRFWRKAESQAGAPVHSPPKILVGWAGDRRRRTPRRTKRELNAGFRLAGGFGMGASTYPSLRIHGLRTGPK